jgi:hypothetical protein
MVGRHGQRRGAIGRATQQTAPGSTDDAEDLWGTRLWPASTEQIPGAAAGTGGGPQTGAEALLALAAASGGQGPATSLPGGGGNTPVAPIAVTNVRGGGLSSLLVTLVAIGLIAGLAAGVAAGIGLVRSGTVQINGAPPSPTTSVASAQTATPTSGAPTGSTPTGTDSPTASPSTPSAYNLMITNVPPGVGAVYLRLNKKNPICLNVAPGHDTNAGMTMLVGDTVTAIWQIGMPCTARTSQEHVSFGRVEAGSRLTNFWFSLSGNQVI